VTIDTATGLVTTIGSLPVDFDAIAFDNAPVVVGYPHLAPGSAAVVSDPFHAGSSVLLVQGTSGNDTIVVDKVEATVTSGSINTTLFTTSTFQKVVVIAGAGDIPWPSRPASQARRTVWRRGNPIRRQGGRTSCWRRRQRPPSAKRWNDVLLRR
jgi:hypothetical protein